jgi:hypothetical protein
MQSILWILFLLLTVQSSLSDEEKQINTTADQEHHAQALLKWLNEEGGYFHPQLEMRRLDPSDPTSFFGMFAKGDIAKDELLFRIPRSMILDSGEEDPDAGGTESSPLTCSTARNLAEQFRLKDKSKYAPYINYLMDTQSPGTIPSGWSESAQSLLERLLGDSEGDFDLQQLLGGDPFLWLDEWYESCDGSDDPLDEFAALLVIQRSWDDILVPMLDMLSHRNGKWLNIKHSDVFDKSNDVEVRAKRDIQKNEQIYSTYNKCESCGIRTNIYGTPDILRDYGFVEQMPQSYFLYPVGFGFRVDYKDYDENGQPIGDVVVTEWINSGPEADDIKMFNGIAKQIKNKKQKFLNVRDEKVSDFEWNTINAYMDALEVAFEAAINSSIPVLVDPKSYLAQEHDRSDWYDKILEDDDDEDDEDDYDDGHDDNDGHEHDEL